MLRVFRVSGVHRRVPWPGDDRQVRRVKPHDSEERLAAPGRATDERNGAVHDDTRIVATGVISDTLAALIPVSRAVRLGFGSVRDGVPPILGIVALGPEQRIPCRHLRLGRETDVEAVGLRWRKMFHAARAAPVGVLHGFRQCAEMPLAEVARRVALVLEQLRQRQFLRLHVAAVGERNAVAIWMTPRDAAPARWAANRRRRVKPVELQPRLGHRVEVRCADDFVTVKPDIPPAKVIAHDENNVGFPGGKTTGQAQDKKQGTKKTAHADDDRRETCHWQKPFNDRRWAQ